MQSSNIILLAVGIATVVSNHFAPVVLARLAAARNAAPATAAPASVAYRGVMARLVASPAL